MSSAAHISSGTLLPQRLALFAGSTLLCVSGFWLLPEPTVWYPAALAAIVIAIWHGAYDTVLAERVMPSRLGQHWRPWFYAGYLLLACAVLLVWGLLPAAALVAFLLYSALHFGTETEHGGSTFQMMSAAATGFLPIAAACAWHPAEVTRIFSAMLQGDGHIAAQVNGVAAALLVPALVLGVAGCVVNRRMLPGRAAVLCTELVLFRLCPPLLAFGVFFCLWHTPEHLVETSRNASLGFDRRVMVRNLRQGMVPWLLAVTGVGVAAWFGRHSLADYAGILFIGLSALTVPHMALALLLQHTPSPRKGGLMHASNDLVKA